MAGINLRGETSGSIEIQSPAVAGDNTIILPNSNGTANQFFKNSATAGTVTYSSMVEDTSGNIGIGTDNPTKSLSILSSQSVMLLLTGTTSTARIGFNVPTTTNNPTIGVINGNDLQIRTGASERLRITSAGNLGIGVTDPAEKLEVNGGKIFIDGNGNRKITLDPGSNTTYDSRIDASHSLVFRSYVDAGAGVKTCTFDTNGDLDLTQGRNIKFASGQGIDFSATSDSSGTMSSELLDDYEEGTFTPAFSFSNLSVSSFSSQQGSYIKVGRIVHVNIYIRLSGSNLSGTPQTSGAVYINLPFVGGTGYSDHQWLSEPAALGRLAEFRGSNDSTNFDRIYHYIGNNNSSMYFGVNKQPCDPQGTDFLYGMSEKSFSGLIGAGNNFEYRHSFTYEAAS